MSRREVRRETRKQIIAACATLLSGQGYQSVTFGELEKATGCSKAVLYGYFINKEYLELAVLEHNLNQRRERLDQMVANSQTAKDKLLTHIKAYEQGEVAFPLLHIALETGILHEEIRKRVNNELLRWKDDLITIIRSGEFLKDAIDIETIALQLIALVESAVIIYKTTQNNTLANLLLQQAKSLIRAL